MNFKQMIKIIEDSQQSFAAAQKADPSTFARHKGAVDATNALVGAVRTQRANQEAATQGTGIYADPKKPQQSQQVANKQQQPQQQQPQPQQQGLNPTQYMSQAIALLGKVPKNQLAQIKQLFDQAYKQAGGV